MKKLLFTYLIGVLLFACKDPYEGQTFTAYDELPLSTYLATRPNDFSLWVEMLKYTDLYNTLNIKTQYTSFVPNNEAMTEYLASKGVNSVTELNRDTAIYLVRYHILHGITLKKSQFSTGAIETNTASDDKLTIILSTTNSDIFINGYSKIVETDQLVTNGIVHTLNKVLIPITATIYDRISTNRYKIMKEAVDLTGYADTLNTVFIEGVDENGQPIKKRYYYTLFSVADSTFNANSIYNLNDLIDSLNVTGTDYTSADNLLNKYIAYHIVSQLKSSGTLSALVDDDLPKNINTLATNELINISPNTTNQLVINYDINSVSGISILYKDIPCKNGVIHEISNWMPVKTPPQTIVIWELTDYADLAAVCDYYQSPTPNGGNNYYFKSLTENEIPTYNWLAVPINKTAVVTYVNNRGNDGVFYNAVHYDHLRLETGAGGWVEMKSPVIVKGKYKVTIAYVSYMSNSNAGQLQCYFNGVKIGASFFISNTSQDMLASKVLSTSYTFVETDDVTLRIVGIDGRRLTLDYIKFEPI